MKKSFYKIMSLLLVVSMIVPLLSILGFAESEDETTDGATVFFNREFEEGWNYINGFGVDNKGGLDVNLSYTKMSPTRFNY